MKPRTILILFIIANIIGTIGVAFFISNVISKDISRGIMLISIIFQLGWIFGIFSILFKKYLKLK